MVVASAAVGLLVGMTGAGGGALMTPMLIFIFGVSPTAAISSDLVAAVVMRPFGAAVHMRRGTVDYALVRWLAAGSVPGALAGAWSLHLLGTGRGARATVEVVLGTALLVGAAAIGLRAWLRRRGTNRAGAPVVVRPFLTTAVGLLGGVMVGLTSVGSGSLMIVLLLFVYPALTSSRLVGTDLVQAIPLTAAAAAGQLLFGHVALPVTVSVIAGSVPAVVVGSLLSSRAPDGILRPLVTLVIVASGLKYVGAPGPVAAAVLVAGVVGGAAWALVRRRARSVGAAEAPAPAAGDGAELAGSAA